MELYLKEIVVINGVKMQKITVDQTTVVFKKLELDDSVVEQGEDPTVPEVIDKTPKPEAEPEIPESEDYKRNKNKKSRR